MPKLKESQAKQQSRIIRAYISKNMELYGIDDENIATKMHFSKRTFQRRKRQPEKFTLEEFWNVVNILKFTEEEKKQFI